MAIPNPFEKGVKVVKKIPPKPALIAAGGGLAIYLVYRGHQNNASDANAQAGESVITGDAGSFQGSPAVEDTLPGVSPIGGGQGALPPVDFGLPLAEDGAPAVDAVTTDPGASDAVADNGSGVLTLNIVASSPPVTASPSTKKATKHVAPKRGFNPGHSKGHEYYLPGVGYVSKARYDAANRRKPKGAGGMPKKKHPSSVHGAPKHPIKRGSPKAHTQPAPRSHVPAKAPNPPKRKRRVAARPKKRKAKR